MIRSGNAVSALIAAAFAHAAKLRSDAESADDAGACATEQEARRWEELADAAMRPSTC